MRHIFKNRFTAKVYSKVCFDVVLRHFIHFHTTHVPTLCAITFDQIALTYEPSHEKTNNLNMRKQRRRLKFQASSFML